MNSSEQEAKGWKWFIYTFTCCKPVAFCLAKYLSCVLLASTTLGSFRRARSPSSSEIAAGNIPLGAGETLCALGKLSLLGFSLEWLSAVELPLPL